MFCPKADRAANARRANTTDEFAVPNGDAMDISVVLRMGKRLKCLCGERMRKEEIGMEFHRRKGRVFLVLLRASLLW